MKKYSFRLALALSGAVSLATFAVTAFQLRAPMPGERIGGSGEAARYHLALFVPRDGGAFFESLAEGALQAAGEAGAALSVHYLGIDGSSLEFAPMLGADGIALCPISDTTALRARLDAVAASGLPLVLVNRAIPSEQPRTFVGTNNYDWGRKAGSLIAEELAIRGEQGTVAVVYSDKSPSVFAERELFEMGLRSALSAASPSMKGGRIEARYTALNPQDAEQVIYELVHATPDLSAVVFTDERDTVAGSQALIDLNLVGRVAVVGSGSGPAVAEYVRKGIVTGSVAADPRLIGAEAIRILAELSGSGYASSSVDTGLAVVSRENLTRFAAGRSQP